jgi:hypothetical protein
MRRRRINLTKEFMSKWFVKIRRKYRKAAMKYYAPTHINEEYD